MRDEIIDATNSKDYAEVAEKSDKLQFVVFCNPQLMSGTTRQTKVRRTFCVRLKRDLRHRRFLPSLRLE